MLVSKYERGEFDRGYPDSKIHGAKMGPTWVLWGPDGPHVGPMNLAIRLGFQADQDYNMDSTEDVTYRYSDNGSIIFILFYNMPQCVWNTRIRLSAIHQIRKIYAWFRSYFQL